MEIRTKLLKNIERHSNVPREQGSRGEVPVPVLE